jgi:hypothetical protein
MSARRVLVGLIAVAVGTAVLVDRLGGIDPIIMTLRMWWPLGLVVLGLGRLVGLARRRWSVLGPLMVIVGGLALLLLTFRLVSWDAYPIIWPSVVVLAGLVLALAGADWDEQRLPHQNELRQFVWLQGKRLVSRAPQFWRADVTILFGAFELDLRAASLHEPAVINVNAIFGTVDVIVPPGVEVHQRRPFLLDRVGIHTAVPETTKGGLTINLLGLFASATTQEALEKPSS